MKELPERIHDDTNGLEYVLVGDYYIPTLRLTEEARPIGHWGAGVKPIWKKPAPPFIVACCCPGNSGRTLPTWTSRHRSGLTLSWSR